MPADIAYSWRPLDPGQVGAWADLIAAVEAHDHSDEVLGESDLIEEFADPTMDFARGSMAVYDGAAMIGHCVLMFREVPGDVHHMYQWGAVRPAYRGLGVGARLLEWSQEAAIGLHTGLFPGLPLALDGSCQARNTDAMTLFAAQGFEQARWFHRMTMELTADLPRPADPPGVSITTLTPGQHAAAMTVRNEAFRDHWNSTEMSPQAWAHWLSYSAFRPGYSFIAYADGAPAGIVIGHEYDAYTQATGRRELYVALVGTRRSARGRGIASALLGHALAAARADGVRWASLEVDADSPTGALGLYERIGFTVADTWITHRKALLAG